MDVVFADTIQDPSTTSSQANINEIFISMKEELRCDLKEMNKKYSFDFELDMPIESKKIVWLIENNFIDYIKPCKVLTNTRTYIH